MELPMSLRKIGLLAVLAAFLSAPAIAQDNEVPYWASIRASEVNMRVGPAESYKIDWVYRRAGLPMKVVRKQEGWRLVEDPDGARGWMLARFLSRDRTAIVTGKAEAEMRAEGSEGAALRWRLEPGVTGALGACDAGWCKLDVAGHKGYVRADRLWGAGEP
jgi:SH3-like domain-containing protein